MSKSVGDELPLLLYLTHMNNELTPKTCLSICELHKCSESRSGLKFENATPMSCLRNIDVSSQLVPGLVYPSLARRLVQSPSVQISRLSTPPSDRYESSKMSFFPLFNFRTTVKDGNTEGHSDRSSHKNMRREVNPARRAAT